MVKLVNRAKMSTATTGTGTITLGPAETGYQSFADAGVADGDIVRYVIEDGTDWEVGTGTYTATGTTLTRTVSESSNSDEAITLSGSAVVFVSAVAEDILTTIGTVTNNDFDLSTGSVFDYTPDSSATATISNTPTQAFDFTIKFNGSGATTSYQFDTATLYHSLDTSAQETAAPQGLTFSPDGTKMYLCGASSDAVHQYDLSSAWDLNTATFTRTLLVTDQGLNPSDVLFKPDGSSMFVVFGASDDVFQYNLSTSWDISTATYALKSFDFTPQDSSPQSIIFNNDGSKLFMCGSSNFIYQYSLSTEYDVSTMSYDEISFDPLTTSLFSMWINLDGDKLYAGTGNEIVEVSLSTPYDLSTASFVDTYPSSGSNSEIPSDRLEGIFFKPNGTEIFIVSAVTDTVKQFNIGSITKNDVIFDSSVKWPDGTQPISPAPDRFAIYRFVTVDGGETWIGSKDVENAF
jgi:hypothetical protein